MLKEKIKKYDLIIVALGIFLGIFVYRMDYHADLIELSNSVGMWIGIVCGIIAISTTEKQAFKRVLILCISMLITYYIYRIYLMRFIPMYQIEEIIRLFIWSIFAIVCGVAGYVVKYITETRKTVYIYWLLISVILAEVLVYASSSIVIILDLSIIFTLYFLLIRPRGKINVTSILFLCVSTVISSLILSIVYLL